MVRLFTYLMVLALSVPAMAQTEEEPAADVGPADADPGPADTVAPDDPAPADDPLSPGAAADGADPENSGRIDDEQALAEDESEVEEQRSAADPFEEEHTPYYFLGVFYRHTWTPRFLISLFTDEQTAADNPSAGLEFTYRKDDFEIITQLWYQAYFVNGPFRGKGDTLQETEFIDSELKAVFIGAAFLWSTMFTDWIGLEYGLDIGIGGVWGDLQRNEARPSDADGSVRGYTACSGPGDPANPVYCEPGGNYGIEPSWLDGGSRPLVYARLAPHLAIRIKPIHQLVFRIDGGFDLFSGFFLGGSAAFGF
jgi:hypothetical protein